MDEVPNEEQKRRIWREVIDCLNGTTWHRWIIPKISVDRKNHIALAVCHDEIQYLRTLADRLRLAVDLAPRGLQEERSVSLSLKQRLKDCPDLPDEELIPMLTQVSDGAVCPACGTSNPETAAGWRRCQDCKSWFEVIQHGN
jgi:hypothetical protein